MSEIRRSTLPRLSARAERGLCIMPRLDVDSFSSERAYADAARTETREGEVGGYCVFGGTPESVVRACAELQDIRIAAGLPRLLFSADCEFGLPMRLRSGGTEFPDAMALAHADANCSGTPAYEAAECIGSEMKLLGLNWNFAPVADINSNPANPIINTRSFSESAEVVGLQARAFARGLRAAGIIATAKHFPGHGDTSQDSHRELPYVRTSLAEHETRELKPFADLIASGIPSIMTAHLAAPELALQLGAKTHAESTLPASLSPYLTEKLLRERFGFDGVIVTDALEMKAITEHFGASEAARLAFEASADVLLLPTTVDSAHQGLAACSSDRVRKSVRRLLSLPVEIPQGSIEERLKQFYIQVKRSQEVSDRLAARAVEVYGEIVLRDVGEVVIMTDERPQATAKASAFAEALRERHLTVRQFTFTESQHASFEKPFVLVTFHRARGYIGGIDMAGSARHALERLATIAQGNIRGLVLIGSPYVDRAFPSVRNVLKTYSEAASSVRAAANVLLGHS